MHSRLTSLLAAAVLCLFSAGASAQTTHTVTQSGFNFSPSTLTIAQGDTVEWVWTGGVHTVTSGVPCVADGLFDMSLNSGAPLASFTFNSAGIVDYFCIPHCGIGMTGVVTVTAGPTCVPALPSWSLAALVVGLLSIGTVAVRRRGMI